jgi:4-hydroxythreonine-4-phosphate dehydrogenase
MIIVWTIGDVNGVGPEIILKAFHTLKQNPVRFAVIGSYKAMSYYAKKLNLEIKLVKLKNIHDLESTDFARHELPVIDIQSSVKINPGSVSAVSGELSMLSVQTATNYCLMKRASAMVTAPINKEAIAKAGYNFIGHTDYLSYLCDQPNSYMMFNDRELNLRVLLATIHVPLVKVPSLIKQHGLSTHLEVLIQSLQRDFNIKSPKLAVLGLNPHASDGGILGAEETDILIPEIKKCKKTADIEGPFPADAFFGTKSYKHYDAVVAMYHDQGLIPFKLLAFNTGVNVTLGLPIVRTSPDHGTAFDIAGKNQADPTSFIEATRLAIDIATLHTKTN